MAWWPFRRQVETALPAEQRAALKSIVAAARWEIIPLKNASEVAGALPPGACVTVTASPGHGIEATIALAERLVQGGYDVVPHLSARMIRDRAHLAELLARARAAGLRQAFVVGGDAREPGEFNDGLALLQAMEELGHSFDDIGVPAYPEGHAEIADEVLLRVLKEKQRYARSMSTQMSFNPDAVASWVRRIRQEGVTLPIHLGVPGAVALTRLMSISAKIGVADSARYLTKNPGMVGHLVRQGAFGADAFLKALAPTLADPAADVRRLHVFTFNQVADTVAWQRQMLEELDA